MNTKPIPFELWKNANPDLVESAESCDSCHGKGFEMCNFCKGDGYTITEGDANSTATCRYCKGERFSCHGKGFEMCQFCKGEGYTITEGNESSTTTCRYCKGEGFLQCDYCKGEKTTIFQLYQTQYKRELSLLQNRRVNAP